jgi:hypothetical protein
LNSIGVSQPHNYKALNKEDYFKQIIDFVQAWKLFEKYCESNGTKIICSTWDILDQENFETIKLEKIINYFKLPYDETVDYLNNLSLLQMKEKKINKRDGHRGLIYHIIWSNAFLKECQKRGWLNV